MNSSITHMTQKLLAERARQQAPTTAPPPPYSATEQEEDDSDSDSDCEEAENLSKPITLTINAAHSIRGSNNLVPTSSSPLADATKFSTLLLHAINQISAANAAAAGGPRRQLKVDLTINCGLTIVGDRNVIGNVGVRSKDVQPVVAGAKRKAGADDDDAEQQGVKVARTE